MYVSVIQLQIKPRQLAEAQLLWKESVLPELELQSDWKNAAFAPTGAGKAMLFTLWETEDAARGLKATRGYRQELAKLTGLGTEVKQIVYRLGTAEEEAYANCKQPKLAIN